MLIRKIKYYSILIIFIMLFFISCEHVTDIESNKNPAPSRELTAKQIMNSQGIISLHYIVYDSIIVNGHLDPSFHPMGEYYIDTCHYKHNQYYLGTPDWNITVYNVCDDTAWNYYNDNLTVKLQMEMEFPKFTLL